MKRTEPYIKAIPGSFLGAKDRIKTMNHLWFIVHAYREELIPETDPAYDDEWDEICTMMAKLSDFLGYHEAPEQ